MLFNGPYKGKYDLRTTLSKPFKVVKFKIKYSFVRKTFGMLINEHWGILTSMVEDYFFLSSFEWVEFCRSSEQCDWFRERAVFSHDSHDDSSIISQIYQSNFASLLDQLENDVNKTVSVQPVPLIFYVISLLFSATLHARDSSDNWEFC